VANPMPRLAPAIPPFSSGPLPRPAGVFKPLPELRLLLARSKPLQARQMASSAPLASSPRRFLEVPADYRVEIVGPLPDKPGAVEMALVGPCWLAARQPCCLGSFAKAGGSRRGRRAQAQRATRLKAPYGECPNLSKGANCRATSSSRWTALRRRCGRQLRLDPADGRGSLSSTPPCRLLFSPHACAAQARWFATFSWPKSWRRFAAAHGMAGPLSRAASPVVESSKTRP